MRGAPTIEMMPIGEGSSGEPTSSRGALESSLVRRDIAAVFGQRLFDGSWGRPKWALLALWRCKGGGYLRAPGGDLGRKQFRGTPTHDGFQTGPSHDRRRDENRAAEFPLVEDLYSTRKKSVERI